MDAVRERFKQHRKENKKKKRAGSSTPYDMIAHEKRLKEREEETRERKRIKRQRKKVTEDNDVSTESNNSDPSDAEAAMMAAMGFSGFGTSRKRC